MGCGADINCFSVSSGKLVASYTADQNFGRIVSLCFHPSNDKLLVAVHLNAVIVFWDLIGTQAAKLSKQQVIHFKLSIYNFNKYLLSCFFSIGIKFKKISCSKCKMLVKNLLLL